MREVEFARGVAPDAVDAEPEFSGLLAESWSLDEEACHEIFKPDAANFAGGENQSRAGKCFRRRIILIVILMLIHR